MVYKLLIALIFIIMSFGSTEQAFAKQDLELLNSFLTGGGREINSDEFKRTDETIFTHEDKVYHFKNLIWENIEKTGGTHKFQTKWYSNGRLISVAKHKASLKTAPWQMWSWINASTLGYGDHKVEFHSGGKMLDSREFQVVTTDEFIEINSAHLNNILKLIRPLQAEPESEKKSNVTP